MQFKTKDLLVTVLPKFEDAELARACLLHTFICRHPTILCHHASCFFGTRGCGHCSLLVSCVRCSALVTYCGQCSLLISCGACSVLGTGGCGFQNSCGPGGSACDPTVWCAGGSRDPFVIEHLEDLVTLRVDLQETLKRLDALQKEGLPSGIASKADAEAMERSLTEALEQVRAAKKGLK